MSLLIENVHESWNDFLTEDIIKELNKISLKIGETYYPSKENVLRFLSLDLNKVKYIVLGIDPYVGLNSNNKPYATGRSFEVEDYNWGDITRKIAITNLLKDIYKYENGYAEIDMIREEIASGNYNIRQHKELFDYLEDNGFLFLNVTLTVGKKTNDHKIHWKVFSNKLLNYIIAYNPNITWILMGRESQNVMENYNVNKIKLTHPSSSKFKDDSLIEKIKENEKNRI